jgi:Helix-turn-helix domain/Transcriptional regulator, AbiEi antitoxin, Type IV TA system
VRDAADRLGLTPVAIRRQISAGTLSAMKRGRDWWIDRRSVERRARQDLPKGRPLSPSLAWGVLLAASGEQQAAEELVVPYRSRMRAWLGAHPLTDYAPQLRARAEVEELDAHPAELPRILERSDVLATGMSAARQVGVMGEPDRVEIYAPRARRRRILKEHALRRTDGGPLRVRWVADDIWSKLPVSAREAPRAAVLVDLLESDDPRARREAARALAA